MADEAYLVFISHASVDTWVAKQIALSIENAGGEVFVDAVDIEKGDAYDHKIRDALQRCVELVVLMTPTAADSKNVWMEVGAVWYANKRLIGILYGISRNDVVTDPRMPQGLKSLQLVDINDTDDYLAEVAVRILEEVGR